MSNVLVAGGAGFIGSHLSEQLVKKGHKVVVIDDLSLGTLSNLEVINSEISFYQNSYEDKDFFTDTVRKHQIEYVFHFAGFSSAPMFDMKESEGMAMNVLGFLKMLEVCRDEKVKRVMYASSSSIYGNAPVQVEDVKVSPPNFYALTKYAMEHTSRLFYDLYGVESVGFRFFSVYGRNERHKLRFANLISQFLWAMQEGKEVVIYGEGDQTRDFIYVLDLCDALIAGMEADGTYAKAAVYNVGTSEAYTLNTMVKMLEDATKTKAIRKYIPNPVKNYVAHTKADIKKIWDDLGFKSSYDLQEGIKDLISGEI